MAFNLCIAALRSPAPIPPLSTTRCSTYGLMRRCISSRCSVRSVSTNGDRPSSEVLEHHPDPVAARHLRRGDANRLAQAGDLTRIWLVDAVQELHQRALAGAVLTQHAVDLGWQQAEVDVLIGPHRA